MYALLVIPAVSLGFIFALSVYTDAFSFQPINPDSNDPVIWKQMVEEKEQLNHDTVYTLVSEVK